MSDANERDATLAQRIRDALGGVPDEPWAWDAEKEIVYAPTGFSADVWATSDYIGPLIAAAPSLLRAALARIEADAARIAALEEQVVLLEREIGLMSTDFPPEVVDDE